MKKAIIAACAGAADRQAIESCIRPAERALEAAFPDRTVVRAFTSRKIAAMTGTDTGAEAAARLKAGGFGEIVIASMHLLPGAEYARLLDLALPVSAPLLDSDGDLAKIACLLSRIATEEGCAVLAAGHPSGPAAQTWARLEDVLPEDVFLAKLDEAPADIARRLPDRPLMLTPLMLTAGRHARRDVEGTWLPALESLGFDVRLRMEGLGARKEIHEMIVEKVQKIIGGNENG